MAMSTRQGESRLKITGKKHQLKKKKKTKRLQNLERLALSLAFVVMRTAKSHFFSTLKFYILLIIQKLVQFSSCILNQANFF